MASVTESPATCRTPPTPSPSSLQGGLTKWHHSPTVCPEGCTRHIPDTIVMRGQQQATMSDNHGVRKWISNANCHSGATHGSCGLRYTQVTVGAYMAPTRWARWECWRSPNLYNSRGVMGTCKEACHKLQGPVGLNKRGLLAVAPPPDVPKVPALANSHQRLARSSLARRHRKPGRLTAYGSIV